MPTPLDEVETFPRDETERPAGVSPQATEWTDVQHDRGWLEAETRQQTFQVGRHGVRSRPAPEARAAAAQLKNLDEQDREAAAAQKEAQRQQATSQRLKAADLKERGIPSFRDSMSGNVSPVTDESGAPLLHYDPRHGIAYDSQGNPRNVSYESAEGPPVLRDPFEGIPSRTDFDTGDQYQVRPGLPWKWVGADQNVKNARAQEERDKAVKTEAGLLGQKLSIEHAELVSGEAAHKQMTKDLVSTIPELTDPKYAGADRDTIVKAVDQHFNQEYGSRQANEKAGLFSDELSDSAKTLRSGIDQRKASAIDMAHRLYDLKDKQLGLGDRVGAEQQQRKDEIETLIAHGRGEQGPLDLTPEQRAVRDVIGNGSSDEVRAAAENGVLPGHVAPAAIAAAHDAEDANRKAEGLAATNPTLADQFKAVGQGILHGLSVGVGDIVKGLPGLLQFTPAGKVASDFGVLEPLRKAYREAGSKIGDSNLGPAMFIPALAYDKALSKTVGGKIGNFVGGAVPFVATSLLQPEIGIPATVSALFSAGYGATKDEALKRGVNEHDAENLANASGAVNGILGLPFKGIGGALRRAFGGSSPQIIREAVEGAFRREGVAGFGKILNNLKEFITSDTKPILGGVAQDVRGQVVAAIDNIDAEIKKTAAERAATVATHMVAAGAVGGGVQAAQNIIAQQYDPERGTFEGVPEMAIGFGLLAGVSHGWDQVARARNAKRALDLIRPGEPGPPAVPGAPPEAPPPAPPGAAPVEEKPVTGRVVEPEGGPPSEPGITPVEEPRAIPERTVAVEPERPAGAPGVQQPVVPTVEAAPTAPAAPVPGSIDEAAHEAATSPISEKPEPTTAQKEAGNYGKGHVTIGPLDITIENPAGSQRSNLDSGKLDELANRTLLKTGTDFFGPAQNAVEEGNYVLARQRIREAGDALARQQPELAKASDALVEGTFATPMQSHYGYIKGTVGADKDQVDVFIKPGTPQNWDGPVYVIDQTKPRYTDKGGGYQYRQEFDEHKAVIGVGSHEEAIAEYQKNYDPDHRDNYGAVSEFPDLASFKKWAESGIKGPAAETKGMARFTPQTTDATVALAFGAHGETLGNLGHGPVPKLGEVPTESGFWTQEDDSKAGATIIVDPEKVARATEGMAPHARQRYIERAVDEEVKHVAALSWERQSDLNKRTLLEAGAEKDELDANMRGLYENWDGLSARQKGHEKIRFLLQEGKPTETAARFSGKLGPKIRSVLRQLLTFIRTLPGKVSPALTRAAAQIRDLMKGISPEEPVEKPTEPVTAPREPVPARGERIEIRGDFATRRVSRTALERRITALGTAGKLPAKEHTVLQTLLRAAPKKEPSETQLAQAQRIIERLEQPGTKYVLPGFVTAPYKKPKGEEHAKQPSPTQIQTGKAPVGKQERPSGEIVQAGRGDQDVGTTPGAGPRREVPGEEVQAPVEKAEPARRPRIVPGIKVSDVLAQKLKDLAEGLGATAPVVQKQLPKEKRALALSTADDLIAEGVDSPDKLAGALPSALHSYAQSLWDIMAATGDVPRGTHDWPTLFARPEGGVIQSTVAMKLLSGEGMTRTQLTALANQEGVATKDADEQAELGIIQVGMHIAETRKPDPLAKFDEMVEAYNNQPNLTAKTSTSKIAQAYSTPLPLAFAASHIADVKGGKSIYEPTAGNGMLLIEADPANVIANELDPGRVARLRSLGFQVTENDATTTRPREKVDRIVANPPFGTVQEEGRSKEFDLAGLPGRTTTDIDHAIALNTLQSLADDGRAVLLVAGINSRDPETRMKAYAGSPQKRDFWGYLYNNYRVIDHFTIDGDLYKKMGAGWPVDFVVIQGRGRAPTQLPTAKDPRIISSWDELRAELGRSDAGRIKLRAYSEREDREAVSGIVADIRAIAGPGEGAEPGERGPRPETRPDVGRSRVGGEPAPVEQPATPTGRGTETVEATGGRPGRSDVQRDIGSLEQRGLELESGGTADFPETAPLEAPAPDKYRVPYKPASAKHSFNILVPRNMEAPIRDSLEKLKSEVGDLDEFVREKLKFKKTDEGFRYLSAEQIDAIAIAIRAVEKGTAAVLGDQGGVGKGMVSAAMLVYAHENGRIPIFLTKDEKNYADMIGFLKDLGREDLVPVFTNNTMSFPDHDGKTWSTGSQRPTMQEIAQTGKLPRGTHILFTSYFQIQNDKPPGFKETPAEVASRKGKHEPPPDGFRMTALRRIAPKAVFVLDESHLASGDSSRAWRLGPLLAAAPGAHYASATFAKRPESMGIYARTTLSHAAPTMDSLVEAMSAGGVPLQQAVSAMLAEDGLYMRRERDFRNVTFRTHINVDSKERDRRIADVYTSGLREILSVSNTIQKATKRVNKIMRREGKSFGLKVAPRVESVNFSAKLHNLVNQYLFAIKSKAIVDRTVDLVKNGREGQPTPHRVVISFQNTMQAAIEGLMHTNFPMSFKGMLRAYLNQQRMLTSGKRVFGRGEVEHFYIGDEPAEGFGDMSDFQLQQSLIQVETNEEGQKIGKVNEDAAKELFRRILSVRFREVEGFIDDLELEEMPLSPIDYIRQNLEAQDIKTQEITGRTVGLGPDGQPFIREASEKSKRAQIRYMDAFNNGDVQVLLINGSASTGISLHSSEKFKNTDPRAMIVGQAHLDINEFMQTLWRIDRTGQLFPPYYEVIQTAIPAELRPAAIRARKMASLNANTTSNAESEIKGEDVDIFNKYGDEIVYKYLVADPIFVNLLQWGALTGSEGSLLPYEEIKESLQEHGKLAQGVTGHLAVLPTEEGEEFWSKVMADYTAFIQYLNEIGQNELVADTLDMKAETISSKQLTPPKPGDSVFDAASNLERVRAEVGRAPRTAEAVLSEADEVIRTARDRRNKWYAEAQDWRLKEENRLREALLNPDRLQSWSDRAGDGRDTIYTAMDLLGETVHLQNDRGLDAYGAVVDVKLDADHPLIPSKQIFTVWVNTTQRTLRLAASQIVSDVKRTPRDGFIEAYKETEERSNERHMITGNLLAGFVSIKDAGTDAKIVQYTTDKGELRQGILMPAKFNAQTLAGKVSVENASHLRQLLDAGRTVIDTDQAMSIAQKKTGTYRIAIKAGKMTGGHIWQDRPLGALMIDGYFAQRGSMMMGEFTADKLPQVFDRLQSLNVPMFFWKAAEGETGLGATVPQFARDYWSEDVKPKVKSTGATMREVLDAVVHTLSPSYGVNKDTVDRVMGMLGERNQVAYVVDRTGEAFEKMFKSMSRADQITFVDRLKRGEPQPTEELREAARFIRKVDTEAWQAAEQAAKAAGFKEPPVRWLENHYRVMWKVIPGHNDPEHSWVPGRGKRPLRGSRGMMKQHTLEDMSEGIAQGGVPFSYNPITNLKMALTDIWKFTTAMKVWTWGKENGLVSFVRGPFPKVPSGMTWLDDSIADVWFPAESGEGLIHAGRYAVEEGFGRLMNNFLSRDLIRQTRTGRTLLWIKNATTALELALSLFHGVFETGEVIGSNIGLGLSQIYNRGMLGKDAGALMTGLTNLIKSIATPRTIATLGSKFREMAGKPDEFFATPEGKEFLKIHPDAREMIGYLFAGGWKPIEVEADWKNQSVRVFTDAVADLKEGTSKNYVGAGLRAFPAANEFLMTPLFDIYIPNLKVGQFVTEMREALRQNDLKFGPQGYYIDRQGRRYDRPTNAELARKVWRFVEDRFGELNYDTLFWNNTFKSAMQLMFRSVTWKLGSVEAFYGAFAGQGKEFINAARERRAPELHRNMAWLFGVFLATAALGTIISTVLGKHKPKNLTDLMFPRIDPTDDKVRVSIPTYIKDLFHLVESPTGYVKASLAGWIGRVADLLSNKDYYGVQIRDTDDPVVKQALRVAEYTALTTFLPFSVRGYKNLSGSQQNTLRKMMALFGIMPAPHYIGQTAAEARIQKFWQGQRTEEGIKPEQFETQRTKRELVSRIRKGLPVDISSELAAGKLKPKEVPAIYKRAQMGYLASSIDRMPLEEAEKVYAAANPDERAQLAPVIARKRAGSAARSGRTMYAGF